MVEAKRATETVQEYYYGDRVRYDGREYEVRVHFDDPYTGGKTDRLKLSRNGIPTRASVDDVELVKRGDLGQDLAA